MSLNPNYHPLKMIPRSVTKRFPLVVQRYLERKRPDEVGQRPIGWRQTDKRLHRKRQRAYAHEHIREQLSDAK